MTVSSTSLRRSGPFTANGEETDFDFDWLVFEQEDVRVLVINPLGGVTELVLGTMYDVEIDPDQNTSPGGTVHIDTAFTPDTGDLVLILGAIPETQLNGLPNTGNWNPRVIERSLDKLTALVQQHSEILSRTVVFPETEEVGSQVTYADKAVRANKNLGFDVEGNLVAGGSFVGDEVPVSAFMETVLDDNNASAALTTLGFSSFGIDWAGAANAAAGRALLNFSSFGSAWVQSSAGDALDTLGFSAFVKTLVDEVNADAFLTELGFSSFGIDLSQLANAGELRTLIGLSTPIAIAEGGTGGTTALEARTNLGATAVGEALFTAGSASAARSALGAGAVGSAVFVASTAEAAQSALGLTAQLGHISGLALANNTGDATNDIDIAVGEASADDQSAIMVLGGALTKQLDAAWAAGTNQGMRDGGSIANGTWHIFLIRNPSTLAVDVLASTSPTSPTMPSGYTQRRRIGSILRESGTIVPFKQYGDFFKRVLPVEDLDVTGVVNTRVTFALSVPLGIVVEARVRVYLERGSADVNGVLSEADEADTAISPTDAPGVNLSTRGASDAMAGQYDFFTNTSGQIVRRFDTNEAGTRLTVYTAGWRDSRGR